MQDKQRISLQNNQRHPNPDPPPSSSTHPSSLHILASLKGHIPLASLTQNENQNQNQHENENQHQHQRKSLPSLLATRSPGSNDVLLGRGGGTNNHSGNVRFRILVAGHKLRYLAANKMEKPAVAREVVAIWRGLTPPGRFLTREKGIAIVVEKAVPEQATVGPKNNHLEEKTIEISKPIIWYDVGDRRARNKASQCLRERTPDVLPFLAKLDQQVALHQQEMEREVEIAAAAIAPITPVAGLGRRKNEELFAEDGDGGEPTSLDLTMYLLREQKRAALAAHKVLNVGDRALNGCTRKLCPRIITGYRGAHEDYVRRL